MGLCQQRVERLREMACVLVDGNDDGETDRLRPRGALDPARLDGRRVGGDERFGTAERIVEPVLQPAGQEAGDEPTDPQRAGLLDLPELDLQALEAVLGHGRALPEQGVLAPERRKFIFPSVLLVRFGHRDPFSYHSRHSTDASAAERPAMGRRGPGTDWGCGTGPRRSRCATGSAAPPFPVPAGRAARE